MDFKENLDQFKTELLNFIVIDIETTGLSYTQDDIIEISALKYEKAVKTDSYNTLIRLSHPLPKHIIQLTGITDQDLAGGKTVKEALKELKGFCGDEVLVFHNQSFDLNFLNYHLEKSWKTRFYNQTLDTLELSKIFLPYLDNHRLETLAAHFEIENKNAHRAASDSEATAELLFKICEFILDRIPVHLLNSLHNVVQYVTAADFLSTIIYKLLQYKQKIALLQDQKGLPESTALNFLENKPQLEKDFTIKEVFADDGLLKQNFPNYELRQGQIAMTQAVYESMVQNAFLLVEAGTGVGKSLAYLIPALKFSASAKERVIISTNTKNLQEQLFYKDIPILSKFLPTHFTAVLLKGRDNYICEKKWQDVITDVGKHLSPEEAWGLLYLIIWKETTKTGDISENTSFSKSSSAILWKKLMADRHFCPGKRCKLASRCYLMDIRTKAEAANLVVVNHSLLFADMLTENASIGEYKYLIIDEAHNLMQSASQYFSASISYSDFITFFNSLFSTKKTFQSGLLVNLKANAAKSSFERSDKDLFTTKIETICVDLQDKTSIFEDLFNWVNLEVRLKGDYQKLRVKRIEDYKLLTEKLALCENYMEALRKDIIFLHHYLENVNSSRFVEHQESMSNLDSILQKIEEYTTTLTILKEPDLSNNAYWLSSISAEDGKYPGGIINYAPLSVNVLLKEKLFDMMNTIIFTSATISIRGSFKYFMSQLGLDLLKEKVLNQEIVESPFDYPNQTVVATAAYLPAHTDAYYMPKSIDLLKNIITKARVGTLVLFTSYKDLNKVYEEMEEFCFQKNITLLAQGKGSSRSSLLKDFKNTGNAVLLGTSSFWEGIDVQGESLSILVLFKLPFQVPSDPIVEAYIEKLAAENKDSFMHYMLPNALLKMRQGFGRLIRSKSDHGAVIILDNRVFTKKYGQYFLETLPSPVLNCQSPLEIYDKIVHWFKRL